MGAGGENEPRESWHRSHVRAQKMPSAGQFPSIFDHRRAYVFGNRRKDGIGVVPQCELLFSSRHFLSFQNHMCRSKRLHIHSGAGRRICSSSFTAAGLRCNSELSTSNLSNINTGVKVNVTVVTFIRTQLPTTCCHTTSTMHVFT